MILNMAKKEKAQEMKKKTKRKEKISAAHKSILDSFKYTDAVINEDIELLKELAKH